MNNYINTIKKVYIEEQRLARRGEQRIFGYNSCLSNGSNGLGVDEQRWATGATQATVATEAMKATGAI